MAGGIRMVSENFEKIFLTILGLGTNVVKVSSVNSELLFQWDTLVLGVSPMYSSQVRSPHWNQYMALLLLTMGSLSLGETSRFLMVLLL